MVRVEGLGAKIRVIRVARGLSGSDLAKQCGVTRAAISAIELGRVSPSVDLLKTVCRQLSIPAGDVLDKDLALMFREPD